MRNLSALDRWISQIDLALQTNVPGVTQAAQASPAEGAEPVNLSIAESQLASALMRVNHTGEVCAQGLYQGQALTAKTPEIRRHMLDAASEEQDHLVWCERRLEELGGQTSLLNPVFYGMSFVIGSVAGALSNPFSLGFVAETEAQVSKHLSSHLERLPKQDLRSRAIVTQMHDDEQRHRAEALGQGGSELSAPVKTLMGWMAKVMTTTTHRI